MKNSNSGPTCLPKAALAALVTAAVLNAALLETAPAASPPPSEEQANPGVFDDRVVFGQSAAFSGPAQALGQAMRMGIEAAFNEQNTAGGVHGRMLELVTMDDRYEPGFAYANTRALIMKEQVFGLIGAVGTPTSRSAAPLADSEAVPFLAPFTGAGFLRNPDLKSVVNLRDSYAQAQSELERAQSGLRQCQAELDACEEKLSRTFLAVVIQWGTESHDVDLHVIDPAGNEFFYNARRHRPHPGELSADTTNGPGVEIWEVAQAPPGEYRVLYNLYGHNGNPDNAIVKGGVYHRDGHDKLRERQLAREGRANARLVAIVTVNDDGSIDIDER